MKKLLSSLLAACAVDVASAQQIVISEIMYHPAGVPENTAQEWVEIANKDVAAVSVAGWTLSKGVTFTIPGGTTIAAGGYLVVAANVAAFQAAHPGFPGAVVGGWVGTLGASDQTIQLSDATAQTIHEVHYSNEGEWAVRGRGPLILTHKGWEWSSLADGGGRTLELRNYLLDASCGQNWGVSTTNGGTPGAANTLASANIAPLIKDVKHRPAVPHSNEAIVVSCNLADELPGATATLRWRLDGAGSFNTLAMSDVNGDGDVEATIPAQANLAVIEFYVSATDGVNTRTWPAPARTSDVGVTPETFGQVTNALFQVDNAYDATVNFTLAANQPIYRMIMTATEKAELLQIQTNAAQKDSDAAMNATFISQDGSGLEVRYLTGIRNRGTGSRLGPPNNYYVGFRNDEPWEDRGAIQLNCRYPHSQVLGALAFDRAGLSPQEAAIVRVRVNGADLAEPGLRMYGRYVRLEPLAGDWPKRHFPNDPDGNLYRMDDHAPGVVGTPAGNLGSGEFRYEGTNPAAYSDTFIKKTNEEQNDYSDLATLCDKLTNTPDATYRATVEQYLNLDQWFTFFATDALVGNQEGGFQTGRTDDAGMYRGLVDTRFILVPHDFDSVFAFGLGTEDPSGGGAGGQPITRSIFSYDGEGMTDGVLGLHRLFTHPDLVPRYYAKVLEQMDTWFNRATLDPLIDQTLGGWVPATAAGPNQSLASAKAYIDSRRAYVLSQIQQNYAITATGNAADISGMKQTTDGSATLSGTFNLAKTYSIMVNGTAATMFQRTVGVDTAGTWKLTVAAGSSFLKRGINHLTANFYDGINGTGTVIKSLSIDVYYSGGTQTTIGANGVPSLGSLGLIAPASYVPGVPVMVRVDVRDATGATDRTVWNGSAALSATNGITLSPNTVTLFNGVGSALVTVGGGTGNFTLTATANGLSAAKAVTSLNGVAQTNVTGTLAGATSWSGIIHVIGDVTVPVGATLTIQPGTHVLVDGTSTAGDVNGKKITINGTLNAPGTLAAPISIAATSVTVRWGGILHTNAQPSSYDFCLISRAGHTATLGHTNKGPMFKITDSQVTLRDCTWGESPGKAMYTAGASDITIQRCLILHTITGPELEDGASLLCEDTNIQETLPHYRESNDAGPDDEDCLYIHNTPGRSFIIRRCVFAKCGDDVMDCLGGPIVIEDSILRQGWDKGISLLNNSLTVSRSQIVDCDKGIALKGTVAATTYTATVDHCTISAEEHNTLLSPWGYGVAPGGGDPDAAATALWTQNKANQSSTTAILRYIVSNSILEAKIPILVDSPYPASNTTPTYTCTHDTDTGGAVAWAGTGNIEAVPGFVDAVNKDFHLTTASPCKNTGNPAAALDADGSRSDMGALPFGGAVLTNLTWPLVNSPYRITTDVTLGAASTLTIEPGVTVLVDENKHILTNGRVRLVGDANRHITLSGVPGQPLKADPADAGLPQTSPKWGGLWIENSPHADNLISYVDFVDAQDVLSGSLATSRGCIEVKDSEAVIDHCTFRGTHLHMIYGNHCSITVQYCDFPNVFAAGELPGALNDAAEPVKMINKFLPGGRCLIRWNTFRGNKGHNDVLDIEGDVQPNVIVQIRENSFLGQNGDENCELSGDVLLDGNLFAHAHKDTPNTSTGYASAFTTSDAGTGTTLVATRNILWDVDRAAALKGGTAAIFEHNTVYNLRADFTDSGGRLNTAAALSFVVPPEGTAPADGAYAGNNIFWTVPRVFGDADKGAGGVGTFATRLQFDNNLVDPATPTAVGTLHPGGLYSLGTGNFTGDPKLVDPANGNFALAVDSPARGATIFGKDLGAAVTGGAWITGEPPLQTASTSATLTVGGPGIFYYKWRLDAGAWSAAIAIDPASPLKFSRTTTTKRTAQLQLNSLTNGTHTVSVIGQDFAGVWQDVAQATVSKSWTVNTALQLIQINEVLADSATLSDTIEFYNGGASAVNVGGYGLTDDPLLPSKYVIPAGTTIPAGGYLTITSAVSGVNLDADGDAVYLYTGVTLVDSVAFGPQVRDLTIGRAGQNRAWALGSPSLGAANTTVRLGDVSKVRINEWLTQGDVLYSSDWIELFNSGTLPVSLELLRVTDNRAGNPNAYVFPALSFIGANGFAKLIADGKPTSGASHLAFSLDGQQEDISLVAYQQAVPTLIDSVHFYPQTSDYSMGRDALGNFVFYELPTRGLANGTGDPAYANALAVLRGLRITELMYNAVGGNDFDYVELRNVGAGALQIGGVQLVQGIAFTFPAMTLNPGQNVLVVAHLAKFRSRYGNTPNVAGVFTGKLDNGGETVAIQVPPPFDANALTFSYNDAWYASTDGLGRSLVVNNPAGTKASVWGDHDTWAASASLGGDPDAGVVRTDTFSGWSVPHLVQSVTDDGDRDGVSALIEFGLGMNNEDALGVNGISGMPIASKAANGHSNITFRIPTNAGAAQGHGFVDVIHSVQVSTDLISWTTIATKPFAASWSGTGSVALGSASGGSIPVTVEDASAAGVKRHLRLLLTWQP